MRVVGDGGKAGEHDAFAESSKTRSRVGCAIAFRRSYANTYATGSTSPFVRTHLFPNPARAGRCTSGGRAERLRAALEADLIFVEVALDLVGGDLDVDRLVAHDAGSDLLGVVRDEGDLPAARVLSAVDAGAARLAACL